MKIPANELAKHLLEAEEGEVNVRDFIFGRTPDQLAAAEAKATAEARKREFFANHDKKYSAQRALGEITPDTDAHDFWHKTAKYADGRTAFHVRRNGATQRWAKRPDDFRIPIKIGFRGYGNITPANAHEFTTIEPPVLQHKASARLGQRTPPKAREPQ